MKRQSFLLFGWLLLATSVAVQAQFNYTINPDLTIVVTTYNGPGGAVAVPATINGLSVTTIGAGAFQSSSNLTSVAFPDSVRSIGDYAFNACSALTNVTIGNGVTNIGFQSFGYCPNLAQVSIPDNVVSLGQYTFYSSGLESVTIGAGVTSIGGAFEECTNLQTMLIGSGMSTFPLNPFGGCNRLWTITVATNNPYYSSLDGVLFDKTQSTLVQFPLGRAGTYTIPNTVTGIALGGFWNCTRLANISIPNSVTYIGANAFLNCYSLLSVTIPNSVTNIGNYAFGSCSSLANLTIGQSVVSIGAWAFTYCLSLAKVTIPDSVTNLGEAAFAVCSNLVDLTLSKNLTSIGSQAFSITGLSSVNVPNNVIGYLEFSDCIGLTNVTVGP